MKQLTIRIPTDKWRAYRSVVHKRIGWETSDNFSVRFLLELGLEAAKVWSTKRLLQSDQSVFDELEKEVQQKKGKQ